MRSLIVPQQINARKKLTTADCQFNIDNGVCEYSIYAKHISAAEAKQKHASVAFSFSNPGFLLINALVVSAFLIVNELIQVNN
jgi:hypothetical protein